jgi:hypothetical protein
MIEILNTVYSENKDVSVKACDNANNLEQKYKCNWLINPAATMDKDDHSSLYWTSRDIPEQETVYIEAPLQYSFSYSEFYSWSSDKSLELPVYLIQKLVRNNLCTQREVKVRGEKQILFVLNEGIYDSEIGISMPIQSNFI